MTTFIKPGTGVLGAMAIPDADDPRWMTAAAASKEIDRLTSDMPKGKRGKRQDDLVATQLPDPTEVYAKWNRTGAQKGDENG